MTRIGSTTSLITIFKAGTRIKTTFLADPIFSSAGAIFPVTPDFSTAISEPPPIGAIPVSHGNHPDHLDSPGRQLLSGAKVFTTTHGAATINRDQLKIIDEKNSEV